MTKPNEAPSNEQEVLAWAEALRISEEKEVNEAICNFQEDATEDNCLCMIREIASKLRAKDAATIELLCKVRADDIAAMNRQADTIAHLKEDVASTNDGHPLRRMDELRAQLAASQEQVKMLRNTGAAVIDDLVIRAKLAEDDSLNISDSILQNFEQALAATAPAVSPDTKEG